MSLGFIILAHNEPDAVRRLTSLLAGEGHHVVIHFDTSAPVAQAAAVRALEREFPKLVTVVSKVHCLWGEWSLVEAVLVALREFERMPDKPDHVHLMSGADFPIRPLADLEEFLRRNPDRDFIECCDITRRRWVKGGLSLERFRFFFPVNFRTSRGTFDRLVRWQRKLRIRRRIPLAMTPHMGSQWWTLRWSTCSRVLDFLRENPRVIRYFRSTWIPDESFFQTVIAHLVPRREIADLQLIFHHLTPTGRPFVFHEDHLPTVLRLPHFFVRKVSAKVTERLIAEGTSRRSRLPEPRHLARARDVVRNAIDRSYEFSTAVPGHPEGPPPPGETAPFVLIVAHSNASADLALAWVRSHPRSIWLGRPFAINSVAVSNAAIAWTGLQPGFTDLRERFQNQFVDTLAHAMPLDRIGVFMIRPGLDAWDPEALKRMPRTEVIRLCDRQDHCAGIPWDTHRMDASRIPDFLDELAAKRLSPSDAMNGSTEHQTPNPAPAPFKVISFGRIGEHFHLEIMLGPGVETPPTLRYLFPGAEDPVLPELVQSLPPDANGRLVCIQGFRSAKGSDPSHDSPILALADSDREPGPPPVPLPVANWSTAEDLLSLLSSAKCPAIWTKPLVLEMLAQIPIPQRMPLLKAAVNAAGREAIEKVVPELAATRDPAILAIHRMLVLIAAADNRSKDGGGIKRNLIHLAESMPIDDVDRPLISEMIERLAPIAPDVAHDLALRLIRTRRLGRTEILDCVAPCLPRDSRWWLPTLGSDDSLGSEQVADALNCIAAACSGQGRPGLARLCLEAAARIHPEAQSISWNLGMLLASLGNTVGATTAFQRVRRHYSTESVSTHWPTLDNLPWPLSPWPTGGYVLPAGRTTWPRITVVTPSYNQAPFLEETILSVLNQNYPNLQYIIIDGNSTDGSREILERYRHRIDHLVIESDKGQTEAINKGFRLADGELLAWLNSDDMHAPGTLHQAALHWLADGADVIAGICAEHRERTFQVINKPSATNRDFNPAQLSRIFSYWFSGTYFFQPEVFFTKAILDRVGLLDESLHYAMDYELWLRFAIAGARLSVADWPFAFFRLHEHQKTSRSVECIAEQCAVRNLHHPIRVCDERRHQIGRQLASLRAKNPPSIVLLTHRFDFSLDDPPQGVVALADIQHPSLDLAEAVIVPIGADRAEIPLLRSLRSGGPDRLIAGWFIEQDLNPHANHEAACLVDLIIPTEARTGEYLRNDMALMGSAAGPGDISGVIRALKSSNEAEIAGFL